MTRGDSKAQQTLLHELLPNVLVIGAGWIGLEVAAAARKRDASATVVEVADRVCALAPFEPPHARKLFERLAIHKHLNGVRGHPPVDVVALAHAFSRFSFMAAALADELTEVDVNPLLVSRDGCVAVDALVVGSAPR